MYHLFTISGFTCYSCQSKTQYKELSQENELSLSIMGSSSFLPRLNVISHLFMTLGDQSLTLYFKEQNQRFSQIWFTKLILCFWFSSIKKTARSPLKKRAWLEILRTSDLSFFATKWFNARSIQSLNTPLLIHLPHPSFTPLQYTHRVIP